MTSAVRKEKTFVIVVGGGPVGLTSALDLGHRNVPTILISENLKTATHPRCNSTNARSMEHFRRLGIAQDIRSNAPLAKFPPHVAFATRFCGYELGRIDLTRFRTSTKTVGGAYQSAEQGITISQLFLEPTLKRSVERKASIDLRFGVRMLSLESHRDGVIAHTENVQTRERTDIHARYMIAADGARSPARRHFGVGMTGQDGRINNAFVAGSMLTYFLRAPTLITESGRPPANLTWILNHDIRAFVFAQDAGERWIVHYQVPEGTHWENVQHDKVLRAIFGRDIPYEMINMGPWAGGLALIAEKYCGENVFFAGDAAHLFTPLGGLGMNTGIGDATNLAWKLAARYQGWGGERLMDSYDPERRPMALRNSQLGVKCSRRKGAWVLPPDIESSGADADRARQAMGDFIVVDDLEEYETSGLQFGERYEQSPIIQRNEEAPIPDNWAGYIPIDYPSARAPDFPMTDGTTLHDALGDGFALVSFDPTILPNPIVDAAARRNMPLKVVNAAPPPGLYRTKLALIRPDRHIAWHGDALPDDPLALIDLVRGA
jgi:2-polyprenyl-6-methoxyphenol hydroxylase-like FAD-dependent oxidoreductase